MFRAKIPPYPDYPKLGAKKQRERGGSQAARRHLWGMSHGLLRRPIVPWQESQDGRGREKARQEIERSGSLCRAHRDDLGDAPCITRIYSVVSQYLLSNKAPCVNNWNLPNPLC